MRIVYLLFLISLLWGGCATSRPSPDSVTVGASNAQPGAATVTPLKFACPEGDEALGEVKGPGDLRVLFCARRAFQETPLGTWSDLYVWTLNLAQDLNRIVVAEKDESVVLIQDPTAPHQWLIRHQVSFPREDLQGFGWRVLSERRLLCVESGCSLEKEQCRLEIPNDPFPKLASEVKLSKRPSRRNRRRGVIPSKPLVDPLLTRKLLYRALDGDRFAQRLLSEIHVYFSMDTSMATEAIQNVALFRRAQRIGCVRAPTD